MNACVPSIFNGRARSVLCEARDWEGLDAMAAERKAHPVGWEPFLETARKFGAPRDVMARLIGRTPDSTAKVRHPLPVSGGTVMACLPSVCYGLSSNCEAWCSRLLRCVRLVQADAYAGIECAREAAEVAARLKDAALFSRIQGMVSASSPAGLAIAQIRERFMQGAGAVGGR
jgi:hypothetical protein